MFTMKKIAFIFKTFQKSNFYGGGEKVFYCLINKFIEKNYYIDIYCSNSDVSEHPGINKITVIKSDYNYRKPESVENFFNAIKNIVQKQQYDYIISDNITPVIDISIIQFHSLGFNPHQLKGIVPSFILKLLKQKRIKYQKKWFKNKPRFVFTVSNILKKDICKNLNIPEKIVKTIYPGVDIPDNISTKQQNTIFTFGLSATGFERKGGYLFLRALWQLKKQGIKTKAKIIYPKHNKNLAIKLLIHFLKLNDIIDFLPLQKNMSDFYNSIDCLVMPSLSEAFGLVALEIGRASCRERVYACV